MFINFLGFFFIYHLYYLVFTTSVAYLARVLWVLYTRNTLKIYYCHRLLAPAILEQSITVSFRNSKGLNTPLHLTRNFTMAKDK